MSKEQLILEKGAIYRTPSGSVVEYSYSTEIYDFFLNRNITTNCYASDGVDTNGKPLFRFAKAYSQTFEKLQS